MSRPPVRNLPPDAEPWGRWVDGELTEAVARTDRTLQTISNTLTGLNGALERLSTQVSDIAKQQEISSLSTASVTGAPAVTLVATTPTPQNVNLGPAIPVTLAPRSQVTAIFTSPVLLQYNPPSAGDFVNGGITITVSGGITSSQSAAFRLQAPVANSQLGGEVTLTCVLNLRNTTASPVSVSVQMGAHLNVLSGSGSVSGSLVAGNGNLLLQSAYLAPTI